MLTKNLELLDMLEKVSIPAPSGERIPLDSNVTPEEGALLQSIIRKVRPTRSLEVGCRYGISGQFICEALTEVGAKEHIIIDAGQRLGVKNVGYYNLIRNGYGNLLTFYTEQSQFALPRLVEQRTEVQFALIDGAHTFDHTLVDFFFVDKMLSIGGVIVFDDSDWIGITKVCKFIFSNRHYKIFDVVGQDNEGDFFAAPKSMVAFQKTEHDNLPKTRNWNHFVDF